MRESLNARIRNLSQTVENAMNGTDGTTTSAVALADWVLEETRAIAEDAVQDARDEAMQAEIDRIHASQPR